jgi:hypothetical protein
MTLSEQLWRTEDHARWFIIPDVDRPRPGTLALRALSGEEVGVDPDWARRYEVAEAEGRAFAKEEFGYTLDEVKRRVDAKLAAMREDIDAARRAPVAPDSPITPNAVPALVALVAKLPRVIVDSLSGEPARVEKAGGELAALKQRLVATGIDIDDRLTEFPERLAALRREFEARGKPKDAPLAGEGRSDH